ncbi:uncharacterized protein DSM5745_01900 [Aspergillus mulundensis]|uniref:Uncharacterized protein n=1 Tax=Aspergillus mulundensis TaxID=1810919 RepID=A0A3D8SV09_9EURO|nr:Uncharacterized protein DSM5745_01900 [Aspergillus mulundensis]RDW90125.1 Uncharacterized protein DSM5745_01900 [Aspergillus mulundensis]
MPTPANSKSPASRGASKTSPIKSKPLDIGKPLGLYDTNSVRAKVRKWQQQGGGVVTADDVIYYEDDNENVPTPESKPKPTNITSRKRSKSTPRKRLVSDEHWKLNRSSTQAPGSKPPAPRRGRIAEYTTNEPIRSPRSAKGDDIEPPLLSPRLTPQKPRDDIKERATSPRALRERRKSHAAGDIDSIISKLEKEHASHGKSSKPASRPSTADKKRSSTISEPAQSPKKKDSALDYDSEWATSEADFSELSKRRARGAPHASKGRTPAKPPKGGILGQIVDESRKMFSKPDQKPEPPKQPAPNRGAKIEAWLSNTQDPFLDDKNSDVEIPAPLKTRRKKRIEIVDEPTEGDSSRLTSPEPSGSSDLSQKTPVRRDRSGETASSGERRKSKDDKSSAKGSQRNASPSPRRRKSSERKTSGKKHSRSSSGTGKESNRKLDEKEKASETGTTSLSEKSEISGNKGKQHTPSTGSHRLSTIASVESMGARGVEAKASEGTEKKRTSSQTTFASEERDKVDPDSLAMVSSQMKKLTTHDDLISVLSTSTTRSRSLRSARSLRNSKSRNPTVADILKELSLDEAKYMRELRTLVGGVIPVLLTCVLSRSDSAIAAGLFRPSADPQDELTFTKPIVNMGVAIERLKLLHKRIPLDAADGLLQWAQGAQKVYREYLKAWRLGFKDVVVNLAPLEEGEETKDADTKSLDDGMSRDENGDIVDADGQKVDVAFLLKRPLVRLKYLAKTFKGINMLEPSPKAEEVAMSYQNLVAEARRRAREERARLEDESASAIDSSRARDPENLGALTEVTVDKTRRVRARDFFNLSLYHSSGQIIDCRAEILFRDNAAEHGPGGDLLICEVDHADRWLLFPPIDIGLVSARNGDKKGEIVLMIRSAPGHERRFQELLSLQIDEEDVGMEWIQMLGRTPVPPAISRSQSFIERARQRQRAQTISSPNEVKEAQRTPPSPTNVAIPIGEKPTSSRASRRSWTAKEWSDPSATDSLAATESQISSQTDITRESDYDAAESEASKPSTNTQSILHSRDPRKLVMGDDKSPQGLKRSGAKRISKYGELGPQSPLSPTGATPSTPSRSHDEVQRAEQTASHHQKQATPKTPTGTETGESPRVSSVPSAVLPSIPKLRQGSSTSYILDSEPEEEYDLDYSVLPETPTKSKRHSRSGSESDASNGDEPPPPPPHSRSPSSTSSSLTGTPVLSPTAGRIRRRGSSPLKHEYEPSTASDSYSDSDTSTVRRYDMYSDSDYVTDSSDEDSEDEIPSRVRSKAARGAVRPDEQETELSTLSLTNSTSQAGYRSVPAQPSKSSSAIATVFAWSDKGSWDSIFPDECKIIISPGLVEAYEMKDDPLANGDDGAKNVRPIVALELTPLVPIRRGTAIDISIRSPPTARSKVTWSNNIMFRSRNAEECEALYGLINQARTNNPTYIALQNARGPLDDLPAPLERATKSSGLFGWPRRRKSYRASASPRSLADNSESSVGTMSSAFSALKRFGGASKMFSISRSSVTSRKKDGEESLYSSSAGSGGYNSGGIGRIAAAIKGVDGIGLSNAKIRLYARETQSKWRDMGAARLTIMPAPSRPPSTSEPRRPDTAVADAVPDVSTDSISQPSSGAASPQRVLEQRNEKRIIIRGKTRGEVLLDVCLDESCFERVARTGIAVSVREENEDGAPVTEKGGVTIGSSRVYMIQMKGEAEAAYTFGLVGKMKY